MGKPSNVQPAKTGESYNWGVFGSADKSGVNLSGQTENNILQAQLGTQQYLNELLNPSYSSESFRARQDLIDESNRQYAQQLGAEAIARGARGSATQNILNSIAANRNANLRQAMTEEDQRVRNILGLTQGIESNYFNQANTMAQNILQRALANQNAQQQANIANTQAQNQYNTSLLGGGADILGSVLGAAAGAMLI